LYHLDLIPYFTPYEKEKYMEPVITIRRLLKTYGNKKVLDYINLDIYPGQIIGYIGPNGAGKSTTVKILTGIIQDYSGEVLVNGKTHRDNLLEIKKTIGYVPELAELYDLLTPYEYLHFVGKLYHMSDELIEERAMRMLDSFGLQSNMHQRMDSFSKGMRQKVLLIAGLLHNPSIVILDEPLSGLDANAVIMVKELLQVLKQEGKTIFYCSHMMDVVEKVSDRIILIDRGNIVADGTIEELRNNGTESLEQIFSKLTSTGDISRQIGDFAAAISEKPVKEGHIHE
jgi:ABC-2 type transport system ATP-binding protein